MIQKDNPELKLSPKERKFFNWGNNEILVASKKYAGMEVLDGNQYRRVPLLAIVESVGYFLVETLISEESVQALEKVTLRFAWAEAVKGLKDSSCAVSGDLEGRRSAPNSSVAK